MDEDRTIYVTISDATTIERRGEHLVAVRSDCTGQVHIDQHGCLHIDEAAVGPVGARISIGSDVLAPLVADAIARGALKLPEGRA